MHRIRQILLVALVFHAWLSPAADRPWHLPPGVTADDYLPGVVIVKLKPEHREAFAQPASGRMEAALRELGMDRPQRLFPRHSPPSAVRSATGHPLVDLSTVYSVRFVSNAGIDKVINRLLSTGFFEYV